MRPGPFRVRAAEAALSTALLAGSAAASPLFDLAGGIGGTSAMNARATGASAASTYHNPALLPDSSQEFDFGVLVLSDQIGMTLDGRTGGVVPRAIGDRRAVDGSGNPLPNSTVPTDWLEHGCDTSQCGKPDFGARPRQGDGSSGNTRSYAVLGLVTRLLDERLVLGFYAIVPMGEFTTARSFYNDEREQFFSNSLHPELYSDRLTATSLSFGGGSRLLEQLSVGASFTLSLTNAATASTYVRDPVDYDKLLLSNDVHVRVSVSPHFGVVYTPVKRLRLSGVVHSEQRMEIQTEVSAALPAGNESKTKRTEVHDFLPWSYGLGLAVDLYESEQIAWTIVSGAELARWSTYVDRHGERPGDEGSAFEWKDTISGTVGVRQRYGPVRTFLDLGFTPSPVPPQIGRRNYVDNDRVGVALGADYSVKVFGVSLRPGLQLAAYRLPSRHQTKHDDLLVDEVPDGARDGNTGKPLPGAAGLQTNNPGWPGFASEGWVLGAAGTLALVY